MTKSSSKDLQFLLFVNSANLLVVSPHVRFALGDRFFVARVPLGNLRGGRLTHSVPLTISFLFDSKTARIVLRPLDLTVLFGRYQKVYHRILLLVHV